MHDLVNAASHALSLHDAELLEQVLEEARKRTYNPAALNLAELTRASLVLVAQVRAAERHLGISPPNPLEVLSKRWEL